eukprot:Gb_18977 [translate_table: standard]
MVSLRNEGRRKRKSLQIPSVINLQGFTAENNEQTIKFPEKNDQRFRSDPIGVSNIANGPVEDVILKNEETRVSTDAKLDNAENKGLDGGKMEPLLTVPESKEEIHVPALQSSCSGADDDEDNIPIGRVLIRKKKGEHLKRKREVLENNDIDNISAKSTTPVKSIALPGKDSKPVKAEQKSTPPIKDRQVKTEQKSSTLDKDKLVSVEQKSSSAGKHRRVKVEQKNNAYERSRCSKFKEGDMVWAKVKSHPWWPGQVYNPAFASSTARKSRKPDHILVAFFGDSSYGWFLESDLIPFEPNYAEKSKQSVLRSFSKAVEEAVDELSRRAALGLMCLCRNPNAFKPAKREGYASVHVEGYGMVGLYSDRQIIVARNSFQPAKLVSFVRFMAVSPWSGEDQGISGVKSVAEVLAYRAQIFTSVDGDYMEALGISESSHTAALDDNTWDQQELGFEGVRRDSAFGPTVVEEKKESPRHIKVKDLARNSIVQDKTNNKKDNYLFKRREGVHEHHPSSSEDHLMDCLVQINDLQKPATSGQVSEEEGYETDGIGKYVFQKRICSEEVRHIATKERNCSKKGLLREEPGLQETQERKREAARKGFHTRVWDTQNEVDKSMFTRRRDKTEFPNEVCSNSEVGIPNDVGFMAGKALESNDSCSLSDLLVSHIARVEARKRSSKKKQKEDMIIGNSSRDNAFPGKALEAEGKGFIDGKSFEVKQQMGPATKIVDKLDAAGHVLKEGPISDDKHLSNTSKLLDREVIDSSNKAWVANASLPCVKDNLLSANDTEGGIEASVAAIKTQKLKIAASAEMGNVTLNDRDLSGSVDHPDYDPVLPTVKESQETRNNLGCALENAGMNLVESVPLSYHSIGLQINKAAEMDVPRISHTIQVDSQVSGRFDVEKGSRKDSPDSQQKFDSIQLATKTDKVGNELPVVSADVVSEAGCNSTPTLQSRPSLDHAVIKKTKGFKRLVKFAKSSGPKDTPDSRICPSKDIHMSDTNLADDLQPPEKQLKVSVGVEGIAETLEKVRSNKAGATASSQNCGRAARPKDDEGCSSGLPDRVEGDELSCRDAGSESSESVLCQLMDDLLALALDPFYGMERDCPSKVFQAFLKFRSLVYQKSLTSLSLWEPSRTASSLLEFEDEQEAMNKCAVRESEPSLPLSDHYTIDVENVHGDGTVHTKSGELPTLANSRMQPPHPQVLKIAKSQRFEEDVMAKENRKRKLDVHSDGSVPLKRLRKLKDINSSSKRSCLEQSIQKLSGISRGDLRESMQKRKKLSKSSSVRSVDSCKSLEEPMALCMRFPRGFALPSEVQLKARFARFGPLDVSGTRIYCNSSSAQVVFKHSSDAETAYKYATENSLFGQADVSFRLKRLFQSKKETVALQRRTEPPKLLKVSNEDVSSSLSAVGQEDFSLFRSLDRHEAVEDLVESTSKSILQSQRIVQLKSCLKKPDESGNNNVKETGRVTFLLDSEESRPEPHITLDGASQTEKDVIYVSVPPSVENNAIVLLPVENNAREPDPPDISHQMLYLLKKCNDVVSDLRNSLGYVSYHSL